MLCYVGSDDRYWGMEDGVAGGVADEVRKGEGWASEIGGIVRWGNGGMGGGEGKRGGGGREQGRGEINGQAAATWRAHDVTGEATIRQRRTTPHQGYVVMSDEQQKRV